MGRLLNYKWCLSRYVRYSFSMFSCEPSTYMWVPLPYVCYQEKAVFSRERMVRYTYAHMHAQAARASLLSLACNSSLSQSSWQSWPPPFSTCLCSSHPPLHMDEGNTNKQKRMTKLTARDFLLGGKDIQNKAERSIRSAGAKDCHFFEFFGTGPSVVSKLWIMMLDHDIFPPDREIKHLLWTLHFLKAYPRQSAVFSTVGGSTGAIDPKTFRKYMWPYIRSIVDLETTMVSMISFKLYSLYFLKNVFRCRNDSGSLNNCLISVDGTDVRIPQQGPAIPGNPFSLFKFKGRCRLWYKIGGGILAGNILWVNEPYAAGKYFDINFFCSGLAHWLDEYKRVEVDDGYIGEAPQKVECPGCTSNPTENQAMQTRVQSRHESLNRRLKNWAILMSLYCHDLMEHGKVFWAIAVITQISINVGGKLFEVDYSD